MAANAIKPVRCAVYTRKSTEHGLELEFNSLDAQRDACEAYIKSQASQGWRALPQHYDDPAYSGGNLDRPALQQLLKDVDAGRIDVIVVYKIDRLTRSLADFAKLVEAFDAKSISFVAVTQQFNTTTSMGRLTLNVLLSFAQFERELSSERVRDKVAASRRKGKWTGGSVPLGYDAKDKKLVINGPKPRLSAISLNGIWNCRVSGNWWRTSTQTASSPSAGTPRSGNTAAGYPSLTVPSPTS
jgi:site-specific DNA recombinase